MRSVNIHEKSITKLIESIDNYIAKGMVPSLAFIYISSKFSVKKLVERLDKYSFLIVGGTTSGEIYGNEEEGSFEIEGQIVSMLVEVNPKALALTLVDVDDEDTYRVGEEIGVWAKKYFEDSSIITLTSGLDFDNDSYTQGIVSKGIEYIFGGATGDDLSLKETLIFTNSRFSNKGVVALALDRSKIDIIGSRAFGWGGVGKVRIVTKAIKNIVYEIDGIPAMDFYTQYLDIDSSQMHLVGLEYPLEVRRRNGQMIYRAVIDFDEELKSLTFAGHVEEKAQVRISTPRGKSIIKYVEESVNKSLEENPNFTPELALVFPCCARKQVLGHLAYLEIEAVQKASNVPVVGFFAYGEIGAFPGGYGFHNETFVTAFLEEKVEV